MSDTAVEVEREVTAEQAQLFREIADIIELNPEQYNQKVWADLDKENPRCGTQHCIAGWACTLRPNAMEWQPDPLNRKLMQPVEADWPGNAVDLLGLDSVEADTLFDGFWKPRENLTVPEALRLLAQGASIGSVSE